jgi:hypothetical protein
VRNAGICPLLKRTSARIEEGQNEYPEHEEGNSRISGFPSIQV